MTGHIFSQNDSEDLGLWETPQHSPGKPFCVIKATLRAGEKGASVECLQQRKGAWIRVSSSHEKPSSGNGDVEVGESLALAHQWEALPIIMRWRVWPVGSPPSLGLRFIFWDPHSGRREQTGVCHPLICTHALGHLCTHTHKEIRRRAEDKDTRCPLLVSTCTCMHTHTRTSTHKPKWAVLIQDYILLLTGFPCSRQCEGMDRCADTCRPHMWKRWYGLKQFCDFC